MENENKKSKKGVSLGIIVIVLLAIMVGLSYYFFRPTSPKEVFISKIEETLNQANAATNNNAEKINSTISLSGNIETTNEEIAQIAQILNNGKLTLNLQADTNSKKMLIGADVNYLNESLINAKAFYQKGDNNVYLFVQDLFDRYFKVSTEEMETEEEMTNVFSEIKDKETASKILKETISENLKEEYFSKENVDEMTKNTMKLTVSELKSLCTNVVTSLKDNQKFLDCFENSGKMKKVLEDTLKEINEMEKDYDSARIEISLYTKESAKDVKKMDAKVVVSETEEGTFILNKVDDNSLTFNVEVKGKTDEIPFTAQALNGTIKKEKIGNDTTKMTVVVENVPEVGKVTLNIEEKKSSNTDLENVDTANAVDFNNMTEQEMMTLYTNLQKMKIYSFIAPFLGIQ